MKVYDPDVYPLVVARTHIAYMGVRVITGVTAPAGLEVVGGTLNFDRTADVRSHFDLELLDTRRLLTTTTGRDLFQPFINEVDITRGVRIPGSLVPPILFPMGVYTVTGRSFSETNGQVKIRIQGQDRSERVRSPLPHPISIPAGAYWDVVFRQLIRANFPEALFTDNWPSDVAPGPGQVAVPLPGRLVAPEINVDAEGDAWARCREGAATIGREIYADYRGLFELVPVPLANSGMPVWSYVDDQNASAVDADNVLSGDDIYQGITVKGGPGVQVTVWDDLPTSRTSRAATRRSRTKTIQANVPDFLSAQARAQSALALEMAGAEKVTFTALANPALEVGDLIRYRRDRIGLSGNYIVNAIDMPGDVTSRMTVTIGKH